MHTTRLFRLAAHDDRSIRIEQGILCPATDTALLLIASSAATEQALLPNFASYLPMIEIQGMGDMHFSDES